MCNTSTNDEVLHTNVEYGKDERHIKHCSISNGITIHWNEIILFDTNGRQLPIGWNVNQFLLIRNEVIDAKLVHRPLEAFQENVAGDMFDPFCVQVSKYVDGCGGFSVWEIKDAVDNACPDGNGVLEGVAIFVLCYRFIIVVILLIDESYGYGGGCMDYVSVCYFTISVAENNYLYGDNFGFSCAYYLRLLARLKSEK